MKILVVEDEEALASGLQFNFEQEGYEVVRAGDGLTALESFREADPPVDLVVLDLMLPGMSGYDTCRAIREIDQQVPVLVLSARTLSEDKTQAFECGSDQYVTKPFALPELLARIRSLLERRRVSTVGTAGVAGPGHRQDCFRFGDVTIDFLRHEVRRKDQVTSPTALELQLLRYFVEHDGVVLSRARILEDVWDEQADLSTRSVDNFVMRLRRMIEANPSEPRHILSVRGTGYRFVAASEVPPSSPGSPAATTGD